MRKEIKEQGIRMLAGALVGISLGTIIGKGIRTLILNRIPVSGILSTTDDLYSIYDAAIVNLVPEGDIESSENQANFLAGVLSQYAEESFLLSVRNENARLIHALESNGITEDANYSGEFFGYTVQNDNIPATNIYLSASGQAFYDVNPYIGESNILLHQYENGEESYHVMTKDPDGATFMVSIFNKAAPLIACTGDTFYLEEEVDPSQVEELCDFAVQAYQNGYTSKEMLSSSALAFLQEYSRYDEMIEQLNLAKRQVNLDMSQKFLNLLSTEMLEDASQKSTIQENLSRYQDEIELGIATQLASRANAANIPVACQREDSITIPSVLVGAYYDQISIQTDEGSRIYTRNESGTESCYSIRLEEGNQYLQIDYYPNPTGVDAFSISPSRPSSNSLLYAVNSEERKDELLSVLFTPIDQDLTIEEVKDTSFYQAVMGDDEERVTTAVKLKK